MKWCSSKERVLSAIDLEELDRAPFTCSHTSSVAERLSQELGIKNVLQLNLKFGVDLFAVSPSAREVFPSIESLCEGHFADKFGIRCSMSEALLRGGQDYALCPPMIVEHPLKRLKRLMTTFYQNQDHFRLMRLKNS